MYADSPQKSFNNPRLVLKKSLYLSFKKNLDRLTEATGVPTATSLSAPLPVLRTFTHWYEITNTLCQNTVYKTQNTVFQILYLLDPGEPGVRSMGPDISESVSQ